MKLMGKGFDDREFFNILPKDWQDVIIAVWDDYKKNASIYILRESTKIIAGGIVFRGAPPNRTAFEIEEGQKYLISDFHYIGFLFVDPEHRGRALGSKWLSALKEQFPSRSYWLTIEEEGLRDFYEKNGFECIAESPDKNHPEWMFVYRGLGSEQLSVNNEQ